MRHQGNREAFMAQGDRIPLKEQHKETLLPLSKGGYKQIPGHSIQVVMGNMPFQEIFSQKDHAAREEIARASLKEFQMCASQMGVDRIPDISDPNACMVLPVRYLPDLFLASPALYAYKTREERRSAHGAIPTEEDQKKKGLFHPALRSLCDAFPNQQWRDLVQVFNRVCRPMARYDGERIPDQLLSRLAYASDVCDDIFIATSHHEVAVRDLGGVRAWLPQRTRNPYAVGIIRRLPFVVVLGRLSGGAVFSAYPAMAADTVEFLRANAKALKALKTDRHLWYYGDSPHSILNVSLGTRLSSSVERMVALSDKGFLLDWLREGYVERL